MSRPLRKCNLALNNGDQNKTDFSGSKFLMLEWRGSNWFPVTLAVPGWHIFDAYYGTGSATKIALVALGKHICWICRVDISLPLTIFSFLRIKPLLFTPAKTSSVHAEEEPAYDRPSTSSGLSGSSLGSISSVTYDPRKPQVKSKWADASPSCKKIEGFHEK